MDIQSSRSHWINKTRSPSNSHSHFATFIAPDLKDVMTLSDRATTGRSKRAPSTHHIAFLHHFLPPCSEDEIHQWTFEPANNPPSPLHSNVSTVAIQLMRPTCPRSTRLRSYRGQELDTGRLDRILTWHPGPAEWVELGNSETFRYVGLDPMSLTSHGGMDWIIL